MGLEVPPLPVSYKVFKERWEAGARTMAELDPKLMEYLERSKKRTKTYKWCLGYCTLLLLLCVFVFGINWLVSNGMVK